MHRIILFCASFFIVLQSASAVTMQWSPVGNAGNAPDAASGNLYGGVGYNYNISTYDVTANQYVEFLNAKQPDGINTLHLYNTSMTNTSSAEISFTSSNPSGQKYSVIGTRGNLPVNNVSWYDAIRFANWLNNGQGNGDTETGAYTLGALDLNSVPVTLLLTHNTGAKIWLPTENEWYKAAYYDPASSAYYLYETSSNVAPTASGPTALANHANLNKAVNDLTPVGAYTGTTSPYGAFDMAGNVQQWNEAVISSGTRGVRGGSYITGPDQSFVRGSFNSNSAGINVGFRLASAPDVIPQILGDFNRDGHVGVADIQAMLTALANLNNYEGVNGLTDPQLLNIGDINGDGVVTNADLQALLDLLKTGSGSLSAVPEPTTIILLACALPGLAFVAAARLSRKRQRLRFPPTTNRGVQLISND